MNDTYTLDFRRQAITLGKKTFTIVQPAYPFQDLFICQVHQDGYVIFGNENDLIELGKIFAYRSVDKDCIIHIPAKKQLTSYLKNEWNCDHGYDLVLLNHSGQFHYKDWKSIRSRLKFNEVITVDFTMDKTLDSMIGQFHHKDNKDVLKTHSNYHTLFLVGSKLVFHHIVDDCYNISSGRELFEEYKGYHDHAHLEYYMSYKDTHYRTNDLTIDFYDKELWMK